VHVSDYAVDYCYNYCIPLLVCSVYSFLVGLRHGNRERERGRDWRHTRACDDDGGDDHVGVYCSPVAILVGCQFFFPCNRFGKWLKCIVLVREGKVDIQGFEC
jgi:hypothetical protein